jgi:hypothetical protein
MIASAFDRAIGGAPLKYLRSREPRVNLAARRRPVRMARVFISPGVCAMVPLMRMLVLAAALLAAPALGFASDALTISPQGEKLAQALDSMGVETKWIAGTHIDWETGLPDGSPETLPGNHTHCSAFVASAAKMLGVYILRPPRHGQVLLANAQNEWLAGAGADKGWRPVASALQAQSLANSGVLVVASYHSHRDNTPGHIAIIRPSVVTPEDIAAAGPTLIQAARVNSSAIPAKQGFAGHIHAWRDDEIVYYAHDIVGQ